MMSLKNKSAGLPGVMPSDAAAWRWFFTLTALSGAAALISEAPLAAPYLGRPGVAPVPQWQILTVAALLLEALLLGLAVVSWLPGPVRSLRLPRGLDALLRRLGPFNWILAAVPLAVYAAVVLWRFAYFIQTFAGHAWLVFIAAGLGALFLSRVRGGMPVGKALLVVLVLYGFVLKALAYLPEVTVYPFSLAWSEASRFYYASLPFAQSIYGESIPLSPWHPSRYLLLSLPYWLPGASLLVLRLWQVILWLLMSSLTGLALMRRVGVRDRLLLVTSAAWAALFLLQGPVYYHLALCLLPVLWGYDRRKPWQTALAVGLASLWAGISRVNWFPVPAALAIVLYIAETPLERWKDLPRYLLKPALWGVMGLALAYAAQETYVALSGNPDTSHFQSTFQSALLWYRLLPSPTHPTGVLPEILLVTAPLLAIWIGSVRRSLAALHPLRWLGLAGVLLVFFAGGLVVSTKIGGGSNIHNMDAYLFFMLTLACLLVFGRIQPEAGHSLRVWNPAALVVAAALIPVLFGMPRQAVFLPYDAAGALEDLNELRTVISQLPPDSEVLFIAQRQLVTFGLVEGRRFTSEYELLTLSEMSISNNTPYLERFERDLRNHRFALIVTGEQNWMIKDPAEYAFAEENNAWTEHVVTPLFQYYRSALTLDRPNVQLFFPK